ncbi:hypothetical protein RB600_010065 [Gaeumannomyces tritici]
MSKAAHKHNLLGLVDEDSGDDLVEQRKPTANTTRKRTASGAPTTASMPPAKKRGGATAAATAKGRGGTANKVTKPAAKTVPASRRRASDQVAAALAEAEAEAEAAAEAPAPRNPPGRRGGRGRGGAAGARGRVIASMQQDDGPEAVEDEEAGEVEASVLSPPDSDNPQTTARRARGRPRAGAATASGAKRPATRDASEPVEEAPEPEPAPVPPRRGRKPAAGKAKAAAAAAAAAPPAAGREDETLEIPETQQAPEEPMDVDVTEDEATGPLIGDELTEISPLQSPPGPAVRHPSISPTKVRSTMDLDESDSSLRRRLGELTKKHDALEAKYRDLREIGVKEAERTFERLKKQTEERDKAANDLIAKLKEELAAQKELAKEGQRHKKDLEAKQAEAASLTSQVAALEGAVAEAKKEVKTLAAKLASSRTVVDSVAASKVPGSALKPGHHLHLGSALKPGTAAARAAAASAEAMQSAAQVAQMKEDLYGDLTGLIVRGVKRTPEEDVFDCIQTGRNGSMFSYITFSRQAPPLAALVSLLTKPKKKKKTHSPPLQALDRQRPVGRELRPGAVHVHAPAGPQPRQGPGRDAARLLGGGDQLPAASCGQVLLAGHEVVDGTHRLRARVFLFLCYFFSAFLCHFSLLKLVKAGLVFWVPCISVLLYGWLPRA